MFRLSFTFLLLFLCFGNNFAQTKSRKQLEREKKRTIEKIAVSKKILAETKEQKQSSLGQLKALNSQINSQEKQIDLMEEDLQMIGLEIQEVGQISKKLNSDLIKLRTEYGEMLFSASKPSNKLNKLAFLFSAKSFNDVLMRYQYLQQYTETRKAQVKQINRLSSILQEKQTNLVSKKTDKERIIGAKVEKTQVLESLKTQQGQVVQELSQKEKELRAEIQERQNSVDRLENLITNVIQRETNRRNKERERRADRIAKERRSSSSNTRANTNSNSNTRINADSEPEEELEVESSSFAVAKGRLPFPVKDGFISGRFGIHEHQLLKGVLEKNDGVDIQTGKNANIRVVYEGIVRSVVNVPGFQNIVAVQHGNFYTVYAKLKNVTVSVGQRIKAKENIGNAATINGVSEINFQVWNGTKAQNPENWLDN